MIKSHTINQCDDCDDHSGQRVVVIGLGMVAISFIEKLLKSDLKAQYQIDVFAEESVLAYNRVGLTDYFEHRSLDKLYVNDLDWYKSQAKLNYHLSSPVTAIDKIKKTVTAGDGIIQPYDKLVIATGSSAVLPKDLPGVDAEGVFSYRTIQDLERMISHAARPVPIGIEKRAIVIGGGLLGLEAAHAVQTLAQFKHVDIIQRSSWLLSRQLDQQAGYMVNESVEKLGITVRLECSVASIILDDGGTVVGVTLKDGQRLDCHLICFAIGIRARDEVAVQSDIACHSRGGIIVDEYLETSSKDIYAVGECACFLENTFGLIAPGIEMATVLAKNLTNLSTATVQAFQTPDLSTKLKLLGVDVASFGDYFADANGPKSLPGRAEGEKFSASEVKALVYKDPFTSTYKKYVFTADGKYLLGGMMIGDTQDYIKLLSIVKSGKPLEIPASQLILGAQKEGEEGLSELPDDVQICSCMNISKGDVVEVVKDGSCHSVLDIKKCTKAGTQCGGCVPLLQSIFESTMKAMGGQVSKALCVHFSQSRVELMHIIAVRQLKSMDAVMSEIGLHPDTIGCSICKPVMASILSTLWNSHVQSPKLIDLQDTNDKYLGNIQRNGTYSVVPRIPAGEITPEKLIVLGEVAKTYGLYVKITGGQRIDLFGALKQDLPEIWELLVNAGFESGHAYGKSLRTVKSCVGTNWSEYCLIDRCRFGQGDSTAFAIALEERYKAIRSPHKIKGGVSGCIRECAEAQSKDFGLIATEKGYNVYVCGNGGSVPKHAQLLIKDCPSEMVYIKTADRLQRTARWLEKLPGGIEYLKHVVLEDSLGINAVLEAQIQKLVGSNFDEWRTVVESPEKRLLYAQFANTTKRVETIEIVVERDQRRPANWPKVNARTFFADQVWNSLEWIPILHISKLHSSCAVLVGDTQLALFSVKNRLYCTQAMCPHKRAFVLHDGLLGDHGTGDVHVACPLHKREFKLATGACSDPDMSIATFRVEERGDGMIWIEVPRVEELDSVLGTDLLKVRAGEQAGQLDGLDLIGRNKVVDLDSSCSDRKLEW